MNSSTQSQRELLWEMVKDIKFAMFTTTSGDGHLHARPMTTQNHTIDADDCLWFFMSKSNDAITDFTKSPNVALIYAHPGKDCYVSVSGIGSVEEDISKKEKFWSKMTEAWFSGGVHDPDLALVCVAIEHAHYWDVKESKIVQLYEIAKAVVTGQPPSDLGKHGEVWLDGAGASHSR